MATVSPITRDTVHGVRIIAVAFPVVAALLAATGCTETPSYFPPCVETAPCPDIDADVDADASGDASVNLADAAVVDVPADADADSPQ
jgi:hypothetical protein